MTRCESYPPCFGTIYFPTAPFYIFQHALMLFYITINEQVRDFA